MENYNRIENNEYGVFYYLDDKYHRLNEPAIEYFNGCKAWFQNGKRHRLGGPAIECNDGDKYWYQNGYLHRLDGPAYDSIKRDKLWFYEGKIINCNSQEEFERLIKLKLFW